MTLPDPSTPIPSRQAPQGQDLWLAIERHHLASYGWARCCCRQDPEEADNVLQAAYLKVFEGKAVFDGRAALKTWLFAVIRRTAAEARRRQALRRFHLLRQYQSEVRPAPPASPEQQAWRGEMRARLRALLAALPRRQCEVVQLVFYHDFSLAEAAQVLGISIGSARTHYERGKRRLRAALQEAGIR
jgi:RNA polymerase sigma-70 factor, ECF subfamily